MALSPRILAYIEFCVGVETEKVCRSFARNRTADANISWVEKKTEPPTVTLGSVDVAKKFVEDDEIAVRSTVEEKITSNHFKESDKNVAANNDDYKFGTATVGSDVAIENKVDGDAIVLFRKFDEANDDDYKFEIATNGSDVTTKFDKEVPGNEENIGSKAPPFTPIRHNSEVVPENSGDAGTVDETCVALFSIDALFKDGYMYRRDLKTLPPAYLNAYRNPNLDAGVKMNRDHFEINLIEMFPKIKALTHKLTITSGVRWHVNKQGFLQEMIKESVNEKRSPNENIIEIVNNAPNGVIFETGSIRIQEKKVFKVTYEKVHFVVANPCRIRDREKNKFVLISDPLFPERNPTESDIFIKANATSQPSKLNDPNLIANRIFNMYVNCV